MSRTNKMFRLYYGLSLFILPSLIGADTGFMLKEGTGNCTGAFTLDSVDMACDNDDGICTIGESLALTGQLTATSTMPTIANVTFKMCMWTYICYPWTHSNTDVCYSLGLQSVDGSSTCPDAGTYTYDSSGAIPSDYSSWNWGWLEGYTLSLSAEFVDVQGSATKTTCSAKVTMVSTTSSGDSSSSSSSYQMGEAIAALGLVVLFVRHRRKVRTDAASNSLLDDEYSPEPEQQRQPPSETHDVEMTSKSSNVLV